jgi:hypothetical protein
VWDEERWIRKPSPFPERIYLILNLGQFLRIFGSRDAIVKNLVWLPTWHQARLLCRDMGISDLEIREALCAGDAHLIGQDTLALYRLIETRLDLR